MKYILTCLMCLMAQSCSSHTHESKPIGVVDEVKISKERKVKYQTPLNIKGDFTPGSK